MKLDFHPKETTKKFEKKKPKKAAIKVPKHKEMIINLSDGEDSDDLAKKNPLRKKKQANIERLKKQLAYRLWQHKLLEYKQMPFDSSTVKFYDERDMFFRMKEARNPSEGKMRKK